MTDFLAVLLTLLVILHLIWMTKTNGFLTLDTVFIVSGWTLSVGTLRILDLSYSPDEVYCWVVTLPLIIYLVTSQLTYVVLARKGQRRKVKKSIVLLSPGLLGYGLLALSIVITLLYYTAVGYNVFLTGLSDTIGGVSGKDYTTLRVESYSNQSGYLYPGYVNQFKNTLLPATAIVVIVYLFKLKKPGRVIMTIIISIITLIGVLGTGQRSMMVFLAYILVVFTYQVDPTKFRLRAAIILTISLPLVLFSTFLLGRNQSGIDAAEGLAEKSGVLLADFIDRIFYIQQWSGQMVFHYTQTQPIQWGTEWVQAISGILPGMSGTDLPRIVFNILYGTDRGTATPSMWGSVFYNFSWFGIIIVAIILGILFQKITFKFARVPSVTLMELVSYSGLAATMGNWIAGGPEYLLNAGPVTFAILWYLARKQKNYSERKLVSSQPLGNVHQVLNKNQIFSPENSGEQMK